MYVAQKPSISAMLMDGQQKIDVMSTPLELYNCIATRIVYCNVFVYANLTVE